MLSDEWPDYGDCCVLAAKVLFDANTGKASASHAQNAFEAAAREAGIFVETAGR
jgi:hypothetical protein